MLGIFSVGEAAKKSEYSKSDDFKELLVLAQILSFQFHIHTKLDFFIAEMRLLH